ncbi:MULTISPECIES: helix-turn-helix transcriptional regulator [Bacillus]|nr:MULTISPECIES: helix-turn-helix transcriptional regulator [Bacillus]
MSFFLLQRLNLHIKTGVTFMEQKELKIPVMLNHTTIGILRKIKGVTASQLADRMLIGHSALNKVESGFTPIADLMNVRLWKALTGLGYSVEEVYLVDAFVKQKGGVVDEAA